MHGLLGSGKWLGQLVRLPEVQNGNSGQKEAWKRDKHTSRTRVHFHSPKSEGLLTFHALGTSLASS